MDIKYVKAESDTGCIVACLAMVTGQTYKKVLKGLQEYWNIEGHLNGVNDETFEAYLAARGYAVQYINHDYIPEERLLKPWPIKPFAPVHICDVYAEDMHGVVMLNDGRIYDPHNKRIRSLNEYSRVYSIAGIWKVTDKLFEVR